MIFFSVDNNINILRNDHIDIHICATLQLLSNSLLSMPQRLIYDASNYFRLICWKFNINRAYKVIIIRQFKQNKSNNFEAIIVVSLA